MALRAPAGRTVLAAVRWLEQAQAQASTGRCHVQRQEYGRLRGRVCLLLLLLLVPFLRRDTCFSIVGTHALALTPQTLRLLRRMHSSVPHFVALNIDSISAVFYRPSERPFPSNYRLLN